MLVALGDACSLIVAGATVDQVEHAVHEVAALSSSRSFAHDPPGRRRVIPQPHQLFTLPRPDPRGLVIGRIFLLPLGGSPHVMIEQHASEAVPLAGVAQTSNHHLVRRGCDQHHVVRKGAAVRVQHRPQHGVHLVLAERDDGGGEQRQQAVAPVGAWSGR